MLLVFCALLSSASLASNEVEFAEVDATAAEVAESEYRRLHEELDRLAKRNAWPGVERTFQKMLATGVEPQFEDLKVAAHAAQASGDIAAARDRLAKASGLKEDKEILDWLWSIDSQYGPVFFAGNPGDVALEPKVMPFDPIQAKAVQHAAKQVEETGIFEGLLPKGDYTFGGAELEVGSSVKRVDLRDDSGVRKSRRKKRKQDD